MNLMSWDRCLADFVLDVTPDTERILSIVEMAKSRRQFIEGQKVSSANVSFIIENYYEVIKELLVALLLKNGLKSKNHQCLISYFYKEYPDYEYEVNLVSQLSFLRNRLNYYGEKIDFSFYDKNKGNIIDLINLILSLIE